ncbi:MAG: sporulation protein YlmC with PRC-barrel domain [Candidatus Nanohaloarchaea archaeon]|jgi:sporulation protein YlmC with PRC-barrel domain
MSENILDFSEVADKQVYTNKGAYCGKLKDVELNLGKFAVRAIVVAAEKGSYLAQKVGGTKNVVIPYRMVQSVDDVLIIKDFQTSDVNDGKEEK